MTFVTEEALQWSFELANDAVYFASPDGQTKYYGFGKQAELIGGSFEQAQIWLAKVQKNQLQPVFGGFAFDEQQINDSRLMNGYFFQPAVVYDVVKQQVMGQKIDLVRQTQSSGTDFATIKDETDWHTRIQVAIDDMQQNMVHEKVVLGHQREIQLTAALNERQIIKSLQKTQPTSYHFVLKHGGELFVSATPERLVKVANGQLATAAVAGTIKRGENESADEALANELWHDQKNRREHQTVVATIKSNLEAANITQLKMPETPQILKNPQVQHLYTPITGTLSADNSLLAIIKQLHPTPALGGKPSTWALETIAAIEKYPRGLFSGPIGVIMPDGDGEFIVGIRSMWYRNKLVNLFAGAGILADSDAAMEYQETDLKLLPMMNVLKEQTLHD